MRAGPPAIELISLPGRTWLGLGAFASLVFLIFASLIPVAMNAVSLGEGRARFADIVSTSVPIASRVDSGSNVLLTVPNGCLGLGLIWSARDRVLAMGAIEL